MTFSHHFQALGMPVKEAGASFPKSDKIGAATVAAIIDAFAPKQKKVSVPKEAMVGRTTVRAIIAAFKKA
jgi:hypothetical protein